MVKVVGPREWGTEVISEGLNDAERLGVRLAWEEPIGSSKEKSGEVANGKGKEKEEDAAMGDATAPSLKELANQVLDSIYALDSAAQQTPFLQHLLSLLRTVVSFDSEHFTSLVTQSRRIAESICGILSGSVRTESQRHALEVTHGEYDVLASLVTLVVEENGNRYKTAGLEAISALTRDYPRTAVAARRFFYHGSESFVLHLEHWSNQLMTITICRTSG